MMTLVIMAACMGSRYGGLKQIDPVGRHGEFILDYSVYDAVKAGFDKVVFLSLIHIFSYGHDPFSALFPRVGTVISQALQHI